jgi:two-component system, sensor histidine kinase and response regulator
MPHDQKVNILLVDDDPSNLEALQAILESLQQNLVCANSGTEALRSVLAQDFAVILLDVQMPDMSGIEAASMIRDRERSKTTPIIFLTGAVRTAEMMFKGYSTGAVDYLMKPVVSGVLRTKVEVFVDLALARLALQDEIRERGRIAGELSKLNMVLEQRHGDLLAANEDLEAFGHSVSHDLRMPLRHIQAYISMVEDSAATKLDPQEQKRLESARNAAQRMSQLIDDLLSFSRVGRTPLASVMVDMSELVKETLGELQPETQGRSIEWDLGRLPRVRGDRSLLQQVWVNLLSNAIKYTRPREPARIQITAVQQDSELVFWVKDNGVGFDMSYADKLFGVFQRMHTVQEFEGTGVGLANVRRIIQRHGGRTWAEAQRDLGTTVYFSLPVAHM